MKQFATLCLIFLSLTLLCSNTQSSKDVAKNLDQALKETLGADIVWLSSGQKHTKKEVLAKLGKPDDQNESRFSYIKNNYKYALNISFEKDHLKEFSYKITNEKKFNIQQLGQYISLDQIFPYPKEGHKKGRFFAYQHGNLLLVFKNNSKKNLVRVNYAP